MQRNTSKPNTQIAFRAREEDREYLRILAAKAHCSQGTLLLKLLYDHGETVVEQMRSANYVAEFNQFKQDFGVKVAGLTEYLNGDQGHNYLNHGDIERWLIKKFGFDYDGFFRGFRGNPEAAFAHLQTLLEQV